MIAIKDPTDMNNILALPKKIRLQNFADAWVMTNFPRKFLNTAFITVVPGLWLEIFHKHSFSYLICFLVAKITACIFQRALR